ncbi:hypothetical protein QVD17_14249 [Tagetes erecta]|uniref:C2H2-type domain-containing protein n=1 Tax=Tagetes erecta TaxID=13708 RepID=A0AAD8KYS7_TARER|nr:hypothetical protein QVD17_14249 [Tagetes erecta]
MTKINYATTDTCKNESSAVEKLDDNKMNIHHVNSAKFTIKPINSTKFMISMNRDVATSVSTTTTARPKRAMATNFKKVEEPTNTKPNGQHHRQVNNDFTVGFVNNEGKLVCSLCLEDFESMKELYSHLRGHLYEDVKKFFTSISNMRNKVRDMEVVDRTEVNDHQDLNEAANALMHWANAYRSMAEITKTDKDVNVNVVEDLFEAETSLMLCGGDHRSMGETSMKHQEVDENLLQEVAECLVTLSQGHLSMGESSVGVQELKGAMKVECKVIHEFDLNVAPEIEEDGHQ